MSTGTDAGAADSVKSSSANSVKPSSAFFRKAQNMGLCVLFQLVMPAVPLLVELIRKGKVSPQNVGLAAGMYSIGLGLGARIPLVWALGVVTGVILGLSLGVTPDEPGASAVFPNLPYWAGGFVILAFLGDRVYHHLILGEGFAPWQS